MAGDTPVGGGTVDRFRGGDSVGRGAADRYAPAAQRSAGSGLRSLRRAIQSPPSENSDNRASPIVGISLRLPRNRRSDVPLHGACRGRGAESWQAAWNIADRGYKVSGVGCPACTMNQIGDSGFCRGDYRGIQAWFRECPKGSQSKPLFLHRRSDGRGYQSPVAFRQGLL